ncbi:NAD(P)/FAD-dependent oxidoreductase [uncultured Alsobacter sp.]|uniref:NAD(P)/FAD-dependent oxidoreductase n=1 Tax=uncultured Alsobacter sp. TaxID=1748258 RepID=UPI0025E33AFC|nr:NAD(P)/FAD-dependent oxidoreductase [uncultured Alsobacter sp.]
MTDGPRHLSCDVAVIGAGPAGLSAATALARAGVGTVLVLDREGEAGGVPRHCGHPPFGLREFGRVLTGPSYAARLRDEARSAGADLRTSHSIVALLPDGRLDVMSPAGRIDLRARRIVLATGMRESSRAARAVGGTRPLGVINTGALQAYLHLEGLVPFRRPLIVGTEWVGLSAVSTCLRHGIRPVAVVEAGRRASAPWPFSLFPRLAGIPVHFGTVVQSIAGRERVEGATLRHADGTVRTLACDGVLFTGAFVPEATLARTGHLRLDPATGAPARDAAGRSSDPCVYVAGNVSGAARSAGWSFRDGRAVAAAVAADLRALPRQAQAAGDRPREREAQP